jgi:YHS domain-containing protein
MLDPICDMTVELARAAGKFGFDGETYFFVVSIVRNY